MILGISGFDCASRLALRAGLSNPFVEVAVVNAPYMDIEYMVYKLQHDTGYAVFGGEIRSMKGIEKEMLVVNGTTVQVFHERDPSKIPWRMFDVSFVLSDSPSGLPIQNTLDGSDVLIEMKLPVPSSVDIPAYILDIRPTNMETLATEGAIGTTSQQLMEQLISVLDMYIDTQPPQRAPQEVLTGSIHADMPDGALLIKRSRMKASGTARVGKSDIRPRCVCCRLTMLQEERASPCVGEVQPSTKILASAGSQAVVVPVLGDGD